MKIIYWTRIGSRRHSNQQMSYLTLYSLKHLHRRLGGCLDGMTGVPENYTRDKTIAKIFNKKSDKPNTPFLIQVLCTLNNDNDQRFYIRLDLHDCYNVLDFRRVSKNVPNSSILWGRCWDFSLTLGSPFNNQHCRRLSRLNNPRSARRPKVGLLRSNKSSTHVKKRPNTYAYHDPSRS